jgi:hypothetical protein
MAYPAVLLPVRIEAAGLDRSGFILRIEWLPHRFAAAASVHTESPRLVGQLLRTPCAQNSSRLHGGCHCLFHDFRVSRTVQASAFVEIPDVHSEFRIELAGCRRILKRVVAVRGGIFYLMLPLVGSG